MAALKKNGEENWKKKVPKVEVKETILKKSSLIENTTTTTTMKSNNDNNFDNNGNNDDDIVRLRKKSNIDRPGGKVGSLQERMSQLQSAQSTWQSRVVEKDAEKFTVAGKMASTDPGSKPRSRRESEMNNANLQESRVRKTPALRRFHGSPPPANDRSYDEIASEASEGDLNMDHLVEVEVKIIWLFLKCQGYLKACKAQIQRWEQRCCPF